jgi:hypothetical protein
MVIESSTADDAPCVPRGNPGRRHQPQRYGLRSYGHVFRHAQRDGTSHEDSAGKIRDGGSSTRLFNHWEGAQNRFPLFYLAHLPFLVYTTYAYPLRGIAKYTVPELRTQAKEISACNHNFIAN